MRALQRAARVRARERELTKLREALATLKDEMEVLAAEHTERMTRVSERAARAEAKADADAAAIPDNIEQGRNDSVRLYGILSRRPTLS